MIGYSCGETRYCGHMEDVTCTAVDTSGTNAQCQCNPGFVEYNNICVEGKMCYITCLFILKYVQSSYLCVEV